MKKAVTQILLLSWLLIYIELQKLKDSKSTSYKGKDKMVTIVIVRLFLQTLAFNS